MLSNMQMIANKITSEMQATYTALYHLEDLINGGCDCEVTLQRLANRLTSHFKSVFNWYIKQDWDTKYEFMVCARILLKMIRKGVAFSRFIAINTNKADFNLFWELVE